jgi:hypothetical protein
VAWIVEQSNRSLKADSLFVKEKQACSKNVRSVPCVRRSDPRWAEGGSLFQLYDLHLDDDNYLVNQEDTLGASVIAENQGYYGQAALEPGLLEYDADQVPDGASIKSTAVRWQEANYLAEGNKQCSFC